MASAGWLKSLLAVAPQGVRGSGAVETVSSQGSPGPLEAEPGRTAQQHELRSGLERVRPNMECSACQTARPRLSAVCVDDAEDDGFNNKMHTSWRKGDTGVSSSTAKSEFAQKGP